MSSQSFFEEELTSAEVVSRSRGIAAPQTRHFEVPSGRTSMELSEATFQKKRFLLFIKILFKTLEQTADSEIQQKAKATVADCTRRNRSGDPAYTPLMDALDLHLRRQVGESHWRRAHLFMQHYMKKDQRRWLPRPCMSPRRDILQLIGTARQREEI